MMFEFGLLLLGFLLITWDIQNLVYLTSPLLCIRYGTDASTQRVPQPQPQRCWLLLDLWTFVIIVGFPPHCSCWTTWYLFPEPLTCLVLPFPGKIYHLPGMKLQQKVCTKKRALEKIVASSVRNDTLQHFPTTMCQHFESEQSAFTINSQFYKASILRCRLCSSKYSKGRA